MFSQLKNDLVKSPPVTSTKKQNLVMDKQSNSLSKLKKSSNSKLHNSMFGSDNS